MVSQNNASQNYFINHGFIIVLETNTSLKVHHETGIKCNIISNVEQLIIQLLYYNQTQLYIEIFRKTYQNDISEKSPIDSTSIMRIRGIFSWKRKIPLVLTFPTSVPLQGRSKVDEKLQLSTRAAI